MPDMKVASLHYDRRNIVLHWRPASKGLREAVEESHALAANTLLAIAFLRASAAFVHHFVWKDGVLRRILAIR